MITAMQSFLSDEEGVDAIEYGILAALIFLVILGSVTGFATNAVGLFTTVAGSMTP